MFILLDKVLEMVRSCKLCEVVPNAFSKVLDVVGYGLVEDFKKDLLIVDASYHRRKVSFNVSEERSPFIDAPQDYLQLIATLVVL